MARLKVTFLPSKTYIPEGVKNTSAVIRNEPSQDCKTIAAVINGLASRTPWRSTCLVKVIAAHSMLARRDIPHSLHFGVHKNASEKFIAHAWLSVGDKVIIGGENLDNYVEIR